MYELHKKAAEKSAFRSPTPSQFPQKCRGIVANVPVPLLASHIRKVLFRSESIFKSQENALPA